MAIVPGPAVVGIASGTKAMSFVERRFNSADFASTSTVSSRDVLGNSMEKPMELTISPPPILSPGMEMPKTLITAWPP